MVVRELFTLLGLDVDAQSFAKGQLAAEGVMKALGLLRDAAVKAAEALKETIFGTAEAGDRIKELAERTGVNAQALQRMAYGAKQSGVEMDQLAMAMNFLAKKGVKDVQGEMLRLADRFSQMPKDGRRAELAMERFGRSGAALVPFLAKGRAEIERLGKEAEEAGLILDEDALGAADRFSDALDALRGSVRGVMYTIGVPLLKALQPLLESLRAWVVQNRKLIATRVTDFLQRLLTVAQWLWEVALSPLVSLVGILIDRFQHLGPILGVVGAAFGLFWLYTLGPALLAAAAIAAVILLIEDLWTYLEGGDSVIGDLMAGLPGVLEAAWARIKLFFDDTLEAAKAIWLGVRLGLVDEFNKAVIAVKQVFIDLWRWVVDTALAVGPKIGEAILSGARTLLPFLPGGGLISAGMDVAGALMGGGAASPAASVAAGAGSGAAPMVNAPQINAPITVNATPGMDEAAVANQTRRQFEDMLRTHASETLEAVK
jgi:hypothetical protein